MGVNFFAFYCHVHVHYFVLVGFAFTGRYWLGVNEELYSFFWPVWCKLLSSTCLLVLAARLALSA